MDGIEPFRLLELPADLRVLIYEEIARTQAQYIIDNYNTDPSKIRPRKNHLQFLLGLYANKQLKEEFDIVWAKHVPQIYFMVPNAPEAPGQYNMRQFWLSHPTAIHVPMLTQVAQGYKDASETEKLTIIASFNELTTSAMAFFLEGIDMLAAIDAELAPLDALKHADIRFNVHRRSGLREVFTTAQRVLMTFTGVQTDHFIPANTRADILQMMEDCPALHTIDITVDYRGHWTEMRLAKTGDRWNEWAIKSVAYSDPPSRLRLVEESVHRKLVPLRRRTRHFFISFHKRGKIKNLLDWSLALLNFALYVSICNAPIMQPVLRSVCDALFWCWLHIVG